MCDQESTRDSELISRIKSGDREALMDYLQARRDDLLRFIERNLGDALRRKTDADDIYQEVSCYCMDSFHSMDLSETAPFSWFCRVAERRIIDAHRKYSAQKRSASREVSLGASGSTNAAYLANRLAASITSPSQVISRREQERQLESAVQQLSADEQLALELRFVKSLPSKEIASRLGKSHGAVRTMLSRAVKRLEQAMNSASGNSSFP